MWMFRMIACNKDELLLLCVYDLASVCCQRQYSRDGKQKQVHLFTANGN